MWNTIPRFLLPCVVWIYVSHLGICTDNLALYKPAWMSSLPVVNGIDSLDAPNAVDGKVSNNWADGVCMHTKMKDTSPWLVVDLLGQYHVTNITLYNRQDCCRARLHDFVLEVFATNPTRCPSTQSSVCKRYTGVFSRLKGTVVCDTPVLGRYVRIWKPTTNGHGDVLNLCEMEVYGEKRDCAATSFRMVNGKQLTSTNVTSISVRSRVSCVVKCAAFGACVGVNYNTDSGVCELLTRPEPSDTVSVGQDWVYYGHDFC